MELPDYGDVKSIKEALAENALTIEQGRILIKRGLATKRAIQSMCNHDMVSDNDPRIPTSSCKHCGFTYGGQMQVIVYG